ncbi:MAG TPA: isoprenylcysteine carboxylmethyltransferase family protein [Spirochaetia bacterium]|nr:isoprenylcysteine carboxylmethyltransferase family protein [Spirochaetia bacterium]
MRLATFWRSTEEPSITVCSPRIAPAAAGKVVEMGPFPFVLAGVTVAWIGFEIWLIVRDRINGKGRPGKDKGTLYFNFIAIIVGLTIAGFLNGKSRFFFPGGRTEAGFWIGIAIMIAGFALRVWAVVALGVSFRTTVETHANQDVVESGPYKLIRHPSYTGLLLLCLGDGISLQNWLSLAFAVLLPLLALLYRIRIEEATLVSAMGSRYQEYQARTKKLIPWIW